MCKNCCGSAKMYSLSMRDGMCVFGLVSFQSLANKESDDLGKCYTVWL